MRKVIAAMNMTLDGFCDHTSMIADDEIHQHYSDLLSNSGTLVYGRISYLLMENYWPTILTNPTGNKSTDEFAALIDRIPKVVFSNTLKKLNWETAALAKGTIEETMSALRQQPGKDIVVGSPGLILATLNLNLVDELQISVQPIIAGNGLLLFKNIIRRIDLTLVKTKIFQSSGTVAFYYEVLKK